MNKEEKSLLLKDLCARLPYGIICKDQDGDYISVNIHNVHIGHLIDQILLGVIQMVLRPLSSMTDEESTELSNIISEWYDKELFDLTEEPFLEYALSKLNYSIDPQLFDWLNAHHFDYRGLIEKDLAIEAPEGMYKQLKT